MEGRTTSDGIDFFDFLYEIWQAKWLFVLIVAICTGLALIPALFRNGGPQVETVETTTAQFGFTLRMYGDPLQRNAGLLLTDFLGLTDPDGDLGLQYAGQISEDFAEYNEIVAKFDRSYGFRFIAGNNVGLVVLKLKDGDEALYQTVYAEFIRASEQQFVQTKAFAERIVQSYRKWEEDRANLPYMSMPHQIMMALQFLEISSVQDGTFRFFDFKPLDLRTTQTSIVTNTTRSPIRMVVLGGIVGFILACVAIMFRIAIKRKNTGATKTG